MATRFVASLPSTFMGFIAVGVGVILTFSWSYRGTPGPVRHWTMIGLVVGLMLVYGVVLWIRSRTEHASEHDGETFYYLGFIYTLVTLVATFAPLLNSAERPESRHVLGLFGLGLITTFVGLTGRNRVTQQFDSTSAQALKQFAVVIERVSADAESAFAEVRNRAVREIDAASSQAAKTHDMAKEQVASLTAGTASAVRNVTEQVVQDFARVARESATELTAFLRDTNGNVTAILQQFEARLGALRLPPEDIGEKLVVILTELGERAELLRRTTSIVGAAYSELEGTLASAVEGARDGSRAFSALAVSADGATAAVTAAKTNVEQFATHLTQIGDLATGLEKLPQEAASIIATLSNLRANLGEANRAWAEVAGVTDGASKSMASAGAALFTLEHETRAAEQSVLNWSGGLMKAGVGLQALTEITERAVRLGKDAAATQVQLSAQISGPLADQLRKHGEAASALASRLQEDLRTSEEAVRKVHHHLIDASRFILSKVESRR